MQSLKKKKLIIANSVLMLLLIVGAAFAWFAVNNDNDVNSNNVTVSADGQLQLSVDNGNTWSSGINLTEQSYIFNGSAYSLSEVKFTDITGSGDGTFLRPTLDQKDGYASISAAGAWTTPGANVDYLRFTLNMKSDEAITVYLGDGSTVKPAAGDSLIGSDVNNKSSYGDFSKDIVTGAVRVSMLDSTDSRLFTWLPYPKIYFSDAAASDYAAGKFIVNPADDSEAYKHKYYSRTDSGMKQLELTDNLITSDISADKLLCVLADDDNDGTYTGEVDICVWLEGTDNEARRAFVGGKFNVNLKLVSTEENI